MDGVIWQMQDQVASAVDNYYNNPLTLLDPSDIEKVTILKNGSAVWGAKGANGVVLIDTNVHVKWPPRLKRIFLWDFRLLLESASDGCGGLSALCDRYYVRYGPQ